MSITTLASIALDRYYVVVYPLDPLKTTRKRSRLWILFLWLYGAFFSSLPLLDTKFNRYVPEGYLTSCSFDYLTSDIWSKAFILAFFCAAWVIPFILITFCYVRICMIVIKSGMSASRHAAQQKKRNIEIRLCVVAAGVIGLWFIAWTPYATIALMGIFDFHQYITPLSSMIPALVCKTASCIDPYIYAITHPRFKRELIKMFCYNKKKDLARTMYYEQPVWKTRASRRGWSYASSDQMDGEGGGARVDVNQKRSRAASSESCYRDRYSSGCESIGENPPYREGRRLSRSSHRVSREMDVSSGSRDYHCVSDITKHPPGGGEARRKRFSKFFWLRRNKLSLQKSSPCVHMECDRKSVDSRELETA